MCSTVNFSSPKSRAHYSHTHHLLSHAQTTSPKSTLSFTQPQQLGCFTKVNSQGQCGILHLKHQGSVEVRCFSHPPPAPILPWPAPPVKNSLSWPREWLPGLEMVPELETAVSTPSIAFAKGHLREAFPSYILALAPQPRQLCHH